MQLRKLAILFSFGLLPFSSGAQDLALSAVTAPASGCYLSANATVTVIVANVLAAPYGGTFDISYTLDGGAAVWESVTTVLPGSGTYIYSFIVKGDFSACQMHTLNFTLVVPGDINPANNILNTSIASDCDPTVGWISFPDTACSGINSGNLVLNAYSGVIMDWKYSTNGGASWNWAGNPTDTQPYLNINTSTIYQVLVASLYGYCGHDSTTAVTVEVVPQSIAGTLPADFNICDNGNGGEIELTGYLGDILGWQMSQDNGTSWNPVANTSDSLLFLNLTDTTMYFVEVQNGICPAVYSDTITLTLIPGTDAGTISGPSLVCNFENDSSLEVNPVVGLAIDWNISYDNGTTWSSTGVADSIYDFAGLTTFTLFAAIIQEQNCPYDTVYHSIVVLPLAPTGGPDVTIYEEDTTQLAASGGSFFLWFPATDISDPNVSDPAVWPLVTTTYYVQVTDINGCIDTAAVLVTVLPDLPSIVIPNLLTPNGDGFNDYLNIAYIDAYPNNELHIFNSYGQVIYHASPYNNEWEAKFNGANVPDGTYYYILNLNDVAVAPDPFQGVITIIGND